MYCPRWNRSGLGICAITFLIRACLCILSIFTLTQAGYGWSSNAARTDRDVQALTTAISVYHAEFGKYPAPEAYWKELLAAGMREPRDTSPAMDQWGRPIVYRIPGKHGEFDVYSYGKDGVDNDGKLDDISSWAGVNDGFYWKTTWPQGRRTIILGLALGFACMFWARVYPWALVGPMAGSIMCLGFVLGCHWLMHPGIVPDRNEPLAITGLLAAVLFVTLIAVLFVNLRKPSNEA